MPTVVCAALCLPQTAQAAGFFGPDPDSQPSVFTYAWRGMGVGTLVGVSAAYLAARRDGYERDDWKALGYGAGFGALGGVALGLTLGFVDLADDNPGTAALVLRDMLMGAALGTVAGVIAGGLSVIGNHEGERVALGASIGALSGTLLGVVVGVIEGRRIMARRSSSQGGRTIEPWAFAGRDPQRGRHWLLGARGTF